MTTSSRGQWATKLGFILSAAGSAVGLGNIWRFPYLTGQNGGAAFVLVYLCCVVLIGVPGLMNEMALGRLTAKNSVGAFRATGASLIFRITGGMLAISVSFFVLSYYTVIAGWTLGYMGTTLSGTAVPFHTFIATPEWVLPLTALAMLVTIIIVAGGISGGIEKANKVMMPALFGLLVLVIIRSLTLPGAMEGVKYYLIPDFTAIDGTVVLKALTQAFFSLGIGWGIILTYGSYMPKDHSIPASSLWVGITDTSVALLSGLMVFPAVFAFGSDPASGPTLVFEVLAGIFPQMPFGNIFGALFYLLLFFAAITSTISMVEVVGSWLIDEKRWSRKKAAWLTGGLAFIAGIPSALSKGASEMFTGFTLLGQVSLMDVMDFLFGTIIMLFVVLMTLLYTGWAMDTRKVVEEIKHGSPAFTRPLVFGIRADQLWVFMVRFVCPAVILLVMVTQLKGLF